MERKFVYRNSDGVRRTMITDDDKPDQLKVFTEVEMDGVLDSIKRDREWHPRRSTNKLVARVPMTIMERSIHEQWDEGDWKKWLNDPENAHWRIWRGRV